MPDFAITQAWTVETVRFPRKMLLERAGPVKKCHFQGRCIPLTTNAQFRCQTCLGLQAEPPCRLFVGSASKPGVKASDVFLFGLHPKIKPETFLVGSEAYKLELKASHMLLRGLHPT